LWSFLGQSYSVHNQEWPQYKKEFVIDDYLSIVVQINGKTKGQISIENGTTQEGVERILFLDEGLRKWIVGKPKKIIYVPNRLINLVF